MVRTSRPHSVWKVALCTGRAAAPYLLCQCLLGRDGRMRTGLRVGYGADNVVLLAAISWCVYMTEAVSAKSAAARRSALRHCVIRVNSQSAVTAFNSALNIFVCVIIFITIIMTQLNVTKTTRRLLRAHWVGS